MSTLNADEKIAQLALLRDLSTRSFSKVLQKTRTHQANTGKFLFSEGVNDKTYVYLLSGEVELMEKGRVIRTIEADSEEALSPLAHKHPREFSARARGSVEYISIESQTLDMLIAWENQANYEVREITEDPLSSESDWLIRLLSKPVFNHASPRELQSLFNSFKPHKVSKGQTLIEQHAPADYFYILVSGKASVVHQTENHPQGLKLAILNPGDTFGEDALISGHHRNASVTMISDGMVIRIKPEHFMSFINHASCDKLTFSDADELVLSGAAQWLDVRMPNEFREDHIDGAKNLPLILLRVKADAELSPNQSYILYCDDGKRSEAGAFLLRQKGYRVSVLDGGLSNRLNEVEELYALDETA